MEGGVGGVGRGVDGAADDEPIGSGLDGFAWGHDTFLVTEIGRRGADSWGDKLDGWGDDFSERHDFERRADEASDTGGGSEEGESFDLLFHIGLEADFGDLGCVEAGEDGDRENEWGGSVEF